MVGFFVRAVGLFYCSEVALDSAYRAYFCAKDVAMTVGDHAFSGAGAAAVWLRVRDQEFDLPGNRTADPYPPGPASVIGVYRARLRVRCIEHIVVINKDSAVAAELIPDVEQIAVLVKYLRRYYLQVDEGCCIWCIIWC